MRKGGAQRLLFLLLLLALATEVKGQAEPKSEITKTQPKAKAGEQQAAPVKAERFDQWTLVCAETKGTERPSCSLVQELVEANTNELVFRLEVGYGPKGNLVLLVGVPRGVSLPRGIDYSADGKTSYRLTFQTCQQGCRALLVVPEELRGRLENHLAGDSA